MLAKETNAIHRQRRKSTASAGDLQGGMIFPLHRTTTGMLFLASLPDPELRHCLDRDPEGGGARRRNLLQDLGHVRRTGFALNRHRSEQGLVAVGVSVTWEGSDLFADISVSFPSARYDEARLAWYASVLRLASTELGRRLVLPPESTSARDRQPMR
ncbi:IclR family transcriptional regulator domain-containing protein [Sphaerimonospora sp. CA-214678]|uniref:IclR family transcriptional regulator domain-containing protein n=1 Tax=Sphaerimonospora sp. CA-214678 TaxID=3240029 RepID=UPI003D91F5CC